MIHFNDDTVVDGEAETLCGLNHNYVFTKTFDEIFLVSVNSVDCPYCRSRLVKQGIITLSRLELIT